MSSLVLPQVDLAPFLWRCSREDSSLDVGVKKVCSISLFPYFNESLMNWMVTVSFKVHILKYVIVLKIQVAA